MPRRALSRTKVQQNHSELLNEWITVAAERYNSTRDPARGQRLKGVRLICREVEEECFLATKKRISLSKTTVLERAKGRESIRDFNAKKRWLTAEEEALVVEFAINTAQRGFPLNHHRLKEHVDVICRGKLAEEFPEDGVGHQWTLRFVERHSEQLHPYWSHALDRSRARAVNPHNTKAYFDLLKKVIDGAEGEEAIQPECMYGMDETGIQQGVGVAERVLGPAGQRVQYQQRSGDRENITVIATICGDGTDLPPAVVYKGEAYQSNWMTQDNPLDASLGYSKKGYIDGEISIEWIKQFEKKTVAKAAGRRRLLLVDGHSSHYTFQFLDYARKHRIHVLCYPSHSTHALQGLDVVIFSQLKRHWTAARDDFERTKGGRVNKTNFLAIYAIAHREAFTPANIKAAFRATGVLPYNPGVITAVAMSPSMETSTHGMLPVRQTSPINALTQFLLSKPHSEVTPEPPVSGAGSETVPNTPRRQHAVRDLLILTSASFLISPSSIPSHITPPHYIPTVISPPKRRYAAVLDEPPITGLERRLRLALTESEKRCHSQKTTMASMQAATILQGVYVGRVQEKLQSQEEVPGNKKRKLLGDGLPKLLEGEEFFSRVAEHEEVQNQGRVARESRKAAREKYKQEVEEWKKTEEMRKGRVAVQRQRYSEAVTRWDEERALARAEGRKAGWSKPKLGKLEAALLKPKLRMEEDRDEEDEHDNSDEDMDVE